MFERISRTRQFQVGWHLTLCTGCVLSPTCRRRTVCTTKSHTHLLDSHRNEREAMLEVGVNRSTTVQAAVTVTVRAWSRHAA